MFCQAASVWWWAMATLVTSMPANQLRNQLSPAYWTMSRNGGDVTTSVTDSSRISGVDWDVEVVRMASG